MSPPRPPHSPADWAAYYALRYEVLRQPWGQPPGSERVPADAEAGARHALLLGPDGAALAVGCLHPHPSGAAQLRFMAVAAAGRGQGYGRAVLRYLEAEARRAGFTEVLLHARAEAVGFYARHGYAVLGPSHVLFGQLPHYLMRKALA